VNIFAIEMDIISRFDNFKVPAGQKKVLAGFIPFILPLKMIYNSTYGNVKDKFSFSDIPRADRRSIYEDRDIPSAGDRAPVAEGKGESERNI